MLNKAQPLKGSLLISEPFMMDPNFKRSVLLLTEHNEEGTIGYVLNQKSSFFLNDVIPDCPDADFPIFIGGPVGADTLHFLHRCNDRLDGGLEIAKGIYWGGDFEMLMLMINAKHIEKHEIKFFIGYSGWEPGQLNKELELNSWLVQNTYKPGMITNNNIDNLWKEIVSQLGPKYAHIANFPENPLWN
ncbi:transcriptional regulator, putative [Arcticibacter svalbardensis MN12-7]|uniref:Transcriptional regulator, putative n=1 Tax=Arcticibacter svalbardensis MN12-7 TaxID=1150600 RepID=R9GVT5_9SPHI|nr:YqgE/AlgH family protein [Arcticibacter svalbardensis]EOR95851.1 transcriptional regulator, putative [Arcticibacter svalbardensis MN12-7]